jgi:ferredoxin-NADP reductase
MKSKLEKIVDGYTMYQVMIISLLSIALVAFILSVLNFISLEPLQMLVSFVLILTVGIATHYACVKFWGAPDNLQSSVISLLILFLIITPSTQIENIVFIVCTSAATILSKYILVLRGRHIFNPVAIAIFIAGVFGYLGAEWWVGSRYLLPIVIISGLFVVLKLRKLPLVIYFIFISTAISLVYFLIFGNLNLNGYGIIRNEILSIFQLHLLSYPTIFLSIYMLTEPNAFPGSKKQEYIYATIIALFFSVPINIGNLIYGTPELALLIGNIYSTFKEQKAKYFLTLKSKIPVSENKQIVEYTFESDRKVNQIEGQYLEWILPHDSLDSRGIKRTFTISAANIKDKNEISFAVKHLEPVEGKQVQSTFKQALEKLEIGGKMYASLLAGDFVLDKQIETQNIFLAGGIGITPFISFLRKKISNQENITDILFYSCNTKDDLAFKEVLTEAQKLGLRLVCCFSKEPESSINTENDEYLGYLTPEIMQKYLATNIQQPKTKFYISGPSMYVEGNKKMLTQLGIKNSQIVTDYFSGLG